MPCPQCEPCPQCGHPRKWELTGGDLGCLFMVPRYTSSSSGPGFTTYVPCACTAIQKREAQMTSPPLPPAAEAATTAAMRTAADMTREMHYAYREFDQAINAAHGEWNRAARAAHRRLEDRLSVIAGAGAIDPPSGGERTGT